MMQGESIFKIYGRIELPNESELKSGILFPILRLENDARSMIVICSSENFVGIDYIGRNVSIIPHASCFLASLNMTYLEVAEINFLDIVEPIQPDLNNYNLKSGYFSSISNLNILNGIGNSGYLHIIQYKISKLIFIHSIFII